MITEQWRPVVGYEGVYEVSDLGRVRRSIKGTGTFPGKILKPAILPDKRQKVTLSSHGQVKNFKVHILVSRAFFGVPGDGIQVNHKDGNPSNNLLDNLEYVTPKENSIHARRVLLKGIGDSHYKSKLSKDNVRHILASNEFHRVLADRYGVSVATIQDARSGRTWRCAR